jgi:hypothetical protein
MMGTSTRGEERVMWGEYDLSMLNIDVKIHNKTH